MNKYRVLVAAAITVGGLAITTIGPGTAQAHHTTVTCVSPGLWRVENSENLSMTFTSPQGPSGSIGPNTPGNPTDGRTTVAYSGNSLTINGVWSNGVTNSNTGSGQCTESTTTTTTTEPTTTTTTTTEPTTTTTQPTTTTLEQIAFNMGWDCQVPAFVLQVTQGTVEASVNGAPRATYGPGTYPFDISVGTISVYRPGDPSPLSGGTMSWDFPNESCGTTTTTEATTSTSPTTTSTPTTMTPTTSSTLPNETTTTEGPTTTDAPTTTEPVVTDPPTTPVPTEPPTTTEPASLPATR